MAGREESSHRLLTSTNTQTKLSPQLKSRFKNKAHSDSDGSQESNSQQSVEAIVKDTIKGSKRRRGSEWEILEGLKEGQRYDNKPQVFTGYLHKKRKWPLKGWHKRYFVIDKGILVYARGPGDITRGKIHGSVDIGLSVISTKSKSKRIDIDAEEFIYHLKAKRLENFTKWLDQLKKHRLFRQHLLTFGNRDGGGAECDGAGAFQTTSLPLTPPDASPTRNILPDSSHSTPAGGRLAVCLIDTSQGLEAISLQLRQTRCDINELQRVMDSLNTANCSETEANDGFSPNVKKDRRKFGLRKKKSGKGSSMEQSATSVSGISPNENQSQSVGQSIFISSPGYGSNTCLNRPQSLTGCEHFGLTESRLPAELREDFLVLAKDIQNNLKSSLYNLTSEKERLQKACDIEATQYLGGSSSNVIASLKHSLNQAAILNHELKSRLARVRDIADLGDITDRPPKNLQGSLSYSSSCLSASEFFDAEDVSGEPRSPSRSRMARDGDKNSESSSENNSLSSEEEEGNNSISSENSEVGPDYPPITNSLTLDSTTGRRTKLPAPRPNTEGFSLWTILCNNIGKDLSQVSMPVALNEPLNMLQRMCEELEYSELLDKASELEDPLERMVYVAAFAVSSYGSSYYRAGSKPFNPLLGETYESIRQDKGFKFVSEQVSHHPPISVCHAESRNFVFWQDVRIKTKFWGKSMEFQPAGTVNVELPRFNEVYQWNKITTCVHNLFSGQRWVDQYGELKIVCSSKISCKMTFAKASYWSAKRHELHGCVMNAEGKAVRNLFGKWSEALYCGVAPSAKCIWRPGTMPGEYEHYYGFTRFAMELNELDTEMSKYLPPTDTRFRPDQRLLEEGDLSGAENLKLVLEQSQRDRRKAQEDVSYEPRWFNKKTKTELEKFNPDLPNECYVYNNKYWEVRKVPGFMNLDFEPLW